MVELFVVNVINAVGFVPISTTMPTLRATLTKVAALRWVIPMAYRAVITHGYTDEEIRAVIHNPDRIAEARAYQAAGHSKEEALRWLFDRYLPARPAPRE